MSRCAIRRRRADDQRAGAVRARLRDGKRSRALLDGRLTPRDIRGRGRTTHVIHRAGWTTDRVAGEIGQRRSDASRSAQTNNYSQIYDLHMAFGETTPAYAPLFARLPWRVELEIAKLLCTLGLKNDGTHLWGHALTRKNRAAKEPASAPSHGTGLRNALPAFERPRKGADLGITKQQGDLLTAIWRCVR